MTPTPEQSRAARALRRAIGLARLSLVAALPMLSGCLVDDPPAYRAPQQTPPRIVGTRATPRLDQILQATSRFVQPFRVPIVSEDAGEGLTAMLFVDLATDSGRLPYADGLTTLPPSTLDAGERTLSLDWTPNSAPGCHRLTLRVAHTSSWVGTVLTNQADLDEVYWFAKLDATPDNANSLVDCPDASQMGTSP